MSRFINPFTDMGFKRIFGQEANKDLLIDFLNNLLEGEHHIEDVTFLDKELLPDERQNRTLIYDVYCKTDTGEHIIVEMQNRAQVFFKERSLVYIAKAITEQSKRGEEGDSYAINAVYGIYFMNFKGRDMEEKFRTDVQLCDRDSHLPFSDKMRMIYLQLPFFTKEEQECNTFFEKWIYLLKNMEILQRMPWAAQYAAFQRLADICETASMTTAERYSYDKSVKVYRDNLAIAMCERQEGREEGLLEGRQEGREEGLKEGLEKGLKEGEKNGVEKATISFIKGMSDKGFSLEDICRVTDLDLQTINTIINN